MEATATRLGVFKEVYSIQHSDEQDMRVHMDASFPYLPEISNYQVVSLTRGVYKMVNH